MIRILDQWSGTFEVDGEKHEDLYDFEFEDGEEFNVVLIPKQESDMKND